MFVLGREKAKDEFDLLIQSGMSFSEARALMREKDRVRRDISTTEKVEAFAASFDVSSAGVTKLAMAKSTHGIPQGLSAVKTLSAVSLQRLPEARQPLALTNRVLKDHELVELAIRRSLVSGSLDLKSCRMTAIPAKAMNNLLIQFGNITSINLNSNLLTTIPAGLAPLCPRLTELSVASNKLRDVPRAILYLPRVTELNLSFNRIEEVDVLQAPEMEVLRLTSNHVSSLDNMSYLRKLHTLHLNMCHMSMLTAHMKKLKNLTYLDLSNNTLVSLALPSRDAVESKAAATGGKEQPAAVVSAAAKIGDKRVWEEVMDPFTGRKSYYCRSTREARRTKPAGFDQQQEDIRLKLARSRQVQLAKAKALGLKEDVPEEVVTQLKDGPPPAPPLALSLKPVEESPLWMELTDEESGYPYFYNTQTGETAWEIPMEAPKPLKGWELTVDTTGSDGMVYYTNLATNITQWEMPAEMDQFDSLENLTELNLSNNRLTAIASSVFRIRTLTDLNAERNTLRDIPTTVSQATALTRLNLSWNAISELPKEIYTMHWLKRLTIDNNSISTFTEDIGLMQNLEVFWFGGNKIERLPFTFGKLRKLQDVMFLANPFVFPTEAEVSQGLDKVRWLCRQEGLNFFRGPAPAPTAVVSGIANEGALVEGEFTKNLLQKLRDAEKTLFLNLNFGNIPKVARHLWDPLWKVTTIQDLRLVDNGFKKLPPQFQNMTCLTNLVLRRNRLVELPPFIDRYSLLTGLHIEGNLLTNLPPAFAALVNLTELNMSANRIAVLPDFICTMTQLVRLVVDTNFLEKLPRDIGNLKQLKYLCCSRNRITHLPESIIRLKKLRTLIVYQNRLGDRGIPDCLCDMDGLKELQLSYNNISRLPFRFTSGKIMRSLKTLWLYGNCFFDIGDLPLRLSSVRDFRIDINPLKNPPAQYASQLTHLMEYASTRIARIRELARRCEAEGWVIDLTRLVPVAGRNGHVIVAGFGTLNEDELTDFDLFVEAFVNGDIYKCPRSLKDVIEELIDIHRFRWFKYIRRVVLEFQEFVQFLYFNNFISDEYITTSLYRPWGRDGEEIECYGIDLDALYVNTGFRTAILDIFRGPARMKKDSVCRYAGPEEFVVKKKKSRLAGLFTWGKKAESADTDSEDEEEDEEAALRDA